MIRRVLAFGLALAVQGGAVCAPFLHAHVDEDHDGHHATEVHAHFSSHAGSDETSSHARPDETHAGVAIEESDRDHALYLQVFVAVEVTPFDIPDISVATFTLTAPVERAPRTFVIVTHGHDPPFAAALDSRPPPLFLS